jgi:hypothetical protein
MYAASRLAGFVDKCEANPINPSHQESTGKGFLLYSEK